MILSNNRFLQPINKEIKRAIGDGGQSLVSARSIQFSMRQMVDLGIADSLDLWCRSSLAKVNISDEVEKNYDLSGKEFDPAQGTAANRPVQFDAEITSYNGTSQFLDLGSSNVAGGATEATFLAWVRSTDISGGHKAILNRWTTGEQSILFGTNNSKLQLTLNEGGGPPFLNIHSTEDVSESAWIMLTGVWEGGNTVRLYQNDTQLTNNVLNSTSITTIGNHTNEHTAIGARFNYASDRSSFFEGRFSDLRVFRKALSASQISDIYNLT